MVLTDTNEDTGEGLGLDGGGNGSWGQRGVQAEQVSSETRNVGSSHRSSGDGIDSTVVPGGGDVGTYHKGEMTSKLLKVLRTRSPDVNNRTVVRVISLGISDCDGTDSDGSANTSGGEGARIGVVVTSGNDGGNTGVDEVGDGFIEG